MAAVTSGENTLYFLFSFSVMIQGPVRTTVCTICTCVPEKAESEKNNNNKIRYVSE